MTSPDTLPLIGMCGSCGYLGYCERRLNARGWTVQLICTDCLGGEAAGAVDPPSIERKGPVRETIGIGRKSAKGAVA